MSCSNDEIIGSLEYILFEARKRIAELEAANKALAGKLSMAINDLNIILESHRDVSHTNLWNNVNRLLAALEES